jgi:hypothetical protein
MLHLYYLYNYIGVGEGGRSRNTFDIDHSEHLDRPI